MSWHQKQRPWPAECLFTHTHKENIQTGKSNLLINKLSIHTRINAYSRQWRYLHFSLFGQYVQAGAPAAWLNYHQEKCTTKAANTKTTGRCRRRERSDGCITEALISYLFICIVAFACCTPASVKILRSQCTSDGYSIKQEITDGNCVCGFFKAYYYFSNAHS